MPRTFAGLMLLVLVLPGRAVAGPPEGVSGKMVLDGVADGLRRYQKETDPEKRMGWLRRLAPNRDPRVTVALGEAMKPARGKLAIAAGCLMWRHHMSPLYRKSATPNFVEAAEWWVDVEPLLRASARQLPR
jgi:hypothetical protein